MKNLSLLGLLLIVFFSCRQDIDIPGTTTTTEEPPIIINEYDPENNLVQGTIYGKVYDESETPVQNALVSYDGKTYTTDEQGRFIIENETMDSEGTFFTVDADGYFRGSRRLYPRDGSVNYANIQLLALNEVGTFNASAGGEVSDNFGLNISFPPNSIQSSTGSIYNGEVTVAAKWLDPTAPNIAEIMPGDLLGLSARVQEVSLETYGMMAVELFDEDGNNINIADGNTATLSFPVPAALISQAPQEIPLWSFYDEQYGIWVEEGSATLQGDKYVGEVSHFSFWNCDAPFPLVYIEGQLVTEDGLPLANASIGIFPDGNNSGRYGTTDNEGFFAGKMPADKELILRFGYYDDDCEFSSINLGTYNVDTNLGPIPVEESGAAFTITGSILNCDGDPVENGVVKIQIGNSRTEVYIGDESTFEIALLNCDNADEVGITVVDIDELEEGDVVELPIEDEVNFGTITACGNTLTEFFTLTVDGKTATTVDDLQLFFELPETNQYPFFNIGFGSDSLANEQIFEFSYSMETGEIGTYAVDDIDFLSINTFNPPYNENALLRCQGACAEVSSFTFTISENGGVGGHLGGVFEGVGEFSSSNGAVFSDLNFSGSFRLPINQ